MGRSSSTGQAPARRASRRSPRRRPAKPAPEIEPLLRRLYSRRAEAAAFVQGLLARGFDLGELPDEPRAALQQLAQGDALIQQQLNSLKRASPQRLDIGRTLLLLDQIDDLMDAATEVLKAFVREFRPSPAGLLKLSPRSLCPCGSGNRFGQCCAGRPVH